MTENQQIKEAFVKLRDFGNIVFNFNSNKPNNRGIAGFVDWVIVTKKLNVVFIEVKIKETGDTLKPDQEALLNRLCSITGIQGSRVHYFLVRDAKQAQNIQKDILNGKL